MLRFKDGFGRELHVLEFSKRQNEKNTDLRGQFGTPSPVWISRISRLFGIDCELGKVQLDAERQWIIPVLRAVPNLSISPLDLARASVRRPPIYQPRAFDLVFDIGPSL